MEYSVQEIAREAGISVDTVRFYQTSGLLPLPARRGRMAVYSEEHLERLQLVRQMAEKGLSLKVIALLLARGGGDASDRALLAALEEEADAPSLSTRELAERLGVPEALMLSVEKTGLAEGQETADGQTRYSLGDLRAAKGALKLLEYGFPLTKLLALAVRHDRAVRKTCDAAIDMFDDYVRKPATRDDDDPEAVARAFKEILPVLVAVIAHHFQRVLVNRALRRLKSRGEEKSLRVALEVAARNRVEVSWR
jgi:DNA-binding transcriptional MerR regulator